MRIVAGDPLRDQDVPASSDAAALPIRRYIAVLAILFVALSVPLAAVILRLARPFDAIATPAQLADIQARRPDTIILPVDLRYNAAFKLARAAQVQPEIVCFGSSRAGGFHAAMFAPRRFYNLSFTAWTTGQLLDIFERTTRQAHPRVAILELDYFLFADHWQQWFATSRTMIHDRPFRYAMASLGSFLRAAASNRTTFETYYRAPTAFIGPQSIQSQEGFRSDGSYAFSQGHVADAQQHYRTADFFLGTVPPDDAISPRLQTPIVRLAELARERGIRLIAVQLPLIRAGVDLLDHDDSYRPRAGAWRDFESESTRSWLADLGIPLFDLARSPIDDDPDNFIDAIHLSENGMDKAMRELWATPGFRAAIDPGASDSAVPSPRPGR
jgi:hypothetical protein